MAELEGRQTTLASLQNALATPHPDEQTTIHLVCGKGTTLTEVARETGVHVNTAKNRHAGEPIGAGRRGANDAVHREGASGRGAPPSTDGAIAEHNPRRCGSSSRAPPASSESTSAAGCLPTGIKSSRSSGAHRSCRPTYAPA
ncbi:hypothetical protein A7982_13966 [Minicystis rosea]|nr:hypothetical protein A7982_13966 [Minicystis rosea]